MKPVTTSSSTTSVTVSDTDSVNKTARAAAAAHPLPQLAVGGAKLSEDEVEE